MDPNAEVELMPLVPGKESNGGGGCGVDAPANNVALAEPMDPPPSTGRRHQRRGRHRECGPFGLCICGAVTISIIGGISLLFKTFGPHYIIHSTFDLQHSQGQGGGYHKTPTPNEEEH